MINTLLGHQINAFILGRKAVLLQLRPVFPEPHTGETIREQRIKAQKRRHQSLKSIAFAALIDGVGGTGRGCRGWCLRAWEISSLLWVSIRGLLFSHREAAGIVPVTRWYLQEAGSDNLLQYLAIHHYLSP